MTIKKQARAKGKEIRRITGLPLPVCMRAAKLIVRDRRYDILGKKIFNEHVTSVPFWCGYECCGTKGYILVGPKGEFEI